MTDKLHDVFSGNVLSGTVFKSKHKNSTDNHNTYGSETNSYGFGANQSSNLRPDIHSVHNRPNSEEFAHNYDTNAISADDKHLSSPNLDQLPDEDINIEFELMLDEMNLSLRAYSMEQKKTMLSTYYKQKTASNQLSNNCLKMSENYIKLKFIDEFRNEIHFKTKMSAKLIQLKLIFCKITKFQTKCLSFEYKKRLIDDNITPKLLKMKTNDVIDVHLRPDLWPVMDSMSAQVKTPVPSDDSGYIRLKVITHAKQEIYFWRKSTSKLGSLMKSYSKRFDIDIHSLRFLFECTRIQASDTPQLLEMKDNDIIDVYLWMN